MPIAIAGFVALALPVAMVFSARPTSGFVHRSSKYGRDARRAGDGDRYGSALAWATATRIPIPALMAVVFVTGIGLSFIPHVVCGREYGDGCRALRRRRRAVPI